MLTRCLQSLVHSADVDLHTGLPLQTGVAGPQLSFQSLGNIHSPNCGHRRFSDCRRTHQRLRRMAVRKLLFLFSHFS